MAATRLAPLACAIAMALANVASAQDSAEASADPVAAADGADDAAGAGTGKRSKSSLPRVDVIGDELALEAQPGSGAIVDRAELESSRTLHVSEALRKVPGVHVRDEEGFSLRPNIGVRGLNPTRSTKVLLLEDGIPAAYAPYGDNASYYHAPIDRYARVEVLKGVGMLRFGPQTIGGVVNYVTPDPPQDPAGYVQVSAGNRDYRNLHLNAGGHGALFDVIHREGDGARDNIALEQTDWNAKYVTDFGDAGALTLRANYLVEDSQVTYSGITDAELARFGASYNPFRNDEFFVEHYGVSATHEVSLGEASLLTTNVYGFHFDRNWWRQSSTTSDTQCGNAFRDARFRGDAVNVDACNSRQGRLREYYSRGIEPRLTLWHGLFGAENELAFGVRFHAETQERLQVNGTSPLAVDGPVAEANRRTTEAAAAFLENRFKWSDFTLIPALRYERIDYFRRNRLTNRQGNEEASEAIPGLGINYAIAPALTLFAGVHEGFAPARAEDIIDNAGGSVDVDPEKSTNLELGLRGTLFRDVGFEAAYFRNDFDNQVAVGSIAGGSTPLAQGETLYQGLELGARWSRDGAFGLDGTPYANVALTWLPDAEQESAFVAVANGQLVAGSRNGNRLPYAPEGLATIRTGYRTGPWDASVEMQAVDDQYADFANTELPIANGAGQVGRIAGHAVFNATLNWTPDASDGFSAWIALKNAGDREYIVDRTRGIQLGQPRQVLVGVRWAF